jgi:hypothetical protein
MARGSDKKGALRDVARNRASKKPATTPPPARPRRTSTPRPAAPAPPRKPAPAPAPRPAPSRRSSAHTRGGTTNQPATGHKTPAPAPQPAAKTGARPETSRQTGPALRRTAAERHPRPAPAVRGRSPTAAPPPVGSAGGTRVTDLQVEVQQLQSRFSQLQAQAQLQDVYQRIGQLDARVNELPRELEALRSRGYIHAGLIDDDIAGVGRQWRETRPQIHNALQLQVNRLNSALATAASSVSRLSARNAASITAASTALAQLQNQIGAARSQITGQLGGVEKPLSFLEETIGRFDWVLEQFHRSPGVVLMDAEAPLMASEAEWERSGEEGPDGILFLTDQRLLFEQNEEVATAKLLGLFATKKEKRQELLLEVPVREIEQIDHGQQGGFLGLGKTEKLHLILTARAPVSRATFELRGQAAADWAVWLKRVQTGEIDRDRAAGYAAEVQAAEARAARFPTSCPNCLAPLPLPGRGSQYLVCGYCGTVVQPAAEGEPPEGTAAPE